MGPWYASYFATWLAFADEAPGCVLILNYDDFRTDPVTVLENCWHIHGCRAARKNARPRWTASGRNAMPIVTTRACPDAGEAALPRRRLPGCAARWISIPPWPGF